MREATPELERILDFCKQILNAETNEEIEVIKEDIATMLHEEGYGEEPVEYFMAKLDEVLELIENEELVFNENGQLVPGPNAEQETIEAGSLEPIPENNVQNNQTLGIAAMGLSLSLLVGCMAVRRKINNSKQHKNL
ncbi:MAG: hypothetical protein OSJ70_03405 [Bacilli bacterium]|nr:hypothetical protein [Bacilli bacterium]